MVFKREAALMPPLVLLAVVGAGCYAGYKLFSKLIEQAQTPAKPKKTQAGEPKDLGGLEWDDALGAYRRRRGLINPSLLWPALCPGPLPSPQGRG